MKIIEDYCIQPRAYADSEGWLKIELEDGDNREAIIKEHQHQKQHWSDMSCTFCPAQSTDKLLVFHNHQEFVD